MSDADRAQASDLMARARKGAMVGLGWTVIGLGIVIAPLPGPLGLPIAAVGATILMRHSAPARRLFVRAKRQAPWPLAGTIARYDRWRDKRRRARLEK